MGKSNKLCKESSDGSLQGLSQVISADISDDQCGIIHVCIHK